MMEATTMDIVEKLFTIISSKASAQPCQQLNIYYQKVLHKQIFCINLTA